MQFIPLFKVSDMSAGIRHYTEVLDFAINLDYASLSS